MENPNGVSGGIVSATLEGVAVTGQPLCLPLLDDSKIHHIQVTLGMLALPGAGNGEVRQSVGSL